MWVVPSFAGDILGMQRRRFLMTSALLAIGALPACAVFGGRKKWVPVKVRIGKTSSGNWHLLREGKPYFIRGAGGEQNLEMLKVSGGNSVRTWGADNAANVLDDAQRLGLAVTIGIWLGHKGHGFKYDDPKMVADQLATARGWVEKYKDHPALLMWGVGNEMEGDGKDPLVWKAVEEIAAMIKQVDSNHPTMTVLAELGEDGIKPKEVARLCPSIDILGVNSYGGIATLPKRLKEAGWSKPYVVTEFGPHGPWEAPKAAWGAPQEPNSTEKAAIYLESYQKAVTTQKDWCLGSYAFLWGHKFEATATWFGVFLPETNEKLGAVDALAFAWTGRYPEKRAPEITRWQSSVDLREVAPSSKHTVQCMARGGAGKLRYRYEIRPEKVEESRPDPGQAPQPALQGIVPPESESSKRTFTAPATEGAYRLFVYVRDGQGGAATANVPFFVKRSG